MTRQAALKKLCQWAEQSLNGSTKEHVAVVREAIRIVNEPENGFESSAWKEFLNEPEKPKLKKQMELL